MSVANLASVGNPTEGNGQLASQTDPEVPSADSGRRLAIDAARGYCLWHAFLIGPLVRALKQLPSSTVGDSIVQQYTHAKWNGFHYIDAGYPLFIILLAASMTLSHERHRREGMTNQSFFLRIARRALLLAIFAFFFYGGFSKSLAGMPFDSVFFQLAGCIFVTGLVLSVLTFRAQVVTLVLLLLGHWAVMTLVYVPGHGYGDFSTQGNVETCVLNSVRQFFERTIWPAGDDDYVRHHLISFCLDIPKMFGSCLLGLVLGQILLSKPSSRRQVLIIASLGAAATAVGWIWSGWFPINKRLWTSSFTLFSGGVGYLHVAAFMQIVEVWRHRWVAFPFAVFGRNSLAAWACFYLLPFDNFALRLFGPGFPPIFGVYRPVVLAITQVMLCWCLFLFSQRSLLRDPRSSSGQGVQRKKGT